VILDLRTNFRHKGGALGQTHHARLSRRVGRTVVNPAKPNSSKTIITQTAADLKSRHTTGILAPELRQISRRMAARGVCGAVIAPATRSRNLAAAPLVADFHTAFQEAFGPVALCVLPR